MAYKKFIEKDELILLKVNQPNNHTIKLRVQNICCAKEASLIKDYLKNVDGINSVFVNVIGRTAFINHDQNTISSTEIIDRLNGLHLGISLMEKGQQSDNDKKSKYKLSLTVFSFILLTVLFIIVIAASIKKLSWAKWVAVVIYIIGGLPMLYRAALDIKRCILANVNLLMVIAVVGTVGLKKWLDGSIIVYVCFVASLLESLCRYKVEKDVAGEKSSKAAFTNVAILEKFPKINMKTLMMESFSRKFKELQLPKANSITGVFL